jgi:hypothetical protein
MEYVIGAALKLNATYVVTKMPYCAFNAISITMLILPTPPALCVLMLQNV